MLQPKKAVREQLQPAPAMPTRFGKYRIEKELGRGATSVVYLAHAAFLRKSVAIKLANSSLVADVRHAQRLRYFLQTES